MIKKTKKDSIFKEAWDNMSSDINKVLPEKLHSTGEKKKFVLWLFIVEIIVLGVASWFGYNWLLK